MSEDKKLRAKVKLMEQQTRDARRLFNLPDTESIVQVYKCSNKGLGKMYITQNYFGFHSKLPKNTLSFPFRKVKSIKPIKLAAIEIHVDGQELVFSNFTKRLEAIQILEHLYDNPVTYTTVDRDGASPGGRRGGAGGGGGGGGAFASGGGGGMWGHEGDGRIGLDLDDDGAGGMMQAQAQSGLVDTQASRRALETAYRARNIGADTMDELARQAETIDRVEQKVENLDYLLDKGERYLRGVESMGGGFKNLVTSEKRVKRKVLDHKGRDVSLAEYKRKVPEVEMDILFKHKDDSLTSAVLVLRELDFQALKADKRKPVEKRHQWGYSEVAKLVVRARHNHLDVWYKDGSRIRLMTAHMQPLTNQFALRIPGLPVEWEPGVKKFDYGSWDIPVAPQKGRSTGGGWFDKKTQSSKLISDAAPDEVKQALAEQDSNLDEISSVMDDLQAMSLAMGEEVDRQTSHLRHVDRRMEDVHHGLQNQEQRVRRML